MAGLLLCIVAAFMALGFAEVGTVTDVCAKCRGVWFDRHEIAAVWTLALATALQGKLSTAGEVVRGTGEVAVHALDGLSTGVEAGGMILEGARLRPARSPTLWRRCRRRRESSRRRRATCSKRSCPSQPPSHEGLSV